MAENQDGQEKSQEPTAKKISDARKKGQVPRSRELNTMALTFLGSATLLLMAPYFASRMNAILTTQFTLKRVDIFDPNAMLAHLTRAIGDALFMLLPFFAVMVAVALLATLAVGGFNVSAEAMQPKFSKFNPIKGMKRIFSAKGLMELLKSLFKFLLVGTATATMLWFWSDELIALGNLNVELALSEGLRLIGWSSLLLSSTLILLALVDVPFQLWQYHKDLKMTQQEVRDEYKETEGKPEVKNRLRQMQREIAVRRMMQEVPKADVVVTNPTHYAVALRYDPDRMQAPQVVAKGKDLVAANIREVAEANNVPQVEAPLLARAIYFNTELDQQIPAGLFLAVAQLLAYVFQLRAYREQGGDIPTAPDTYPVPEELRHD
ncbi:MAG: flagellar type III secretion system protein FlhB [Gammaproteobacteria bacterium]|nr:flagellar type III secretion system protein FlhB [Gammaproteobacteria bacterium]